MKVSLTYIVSHIDKALAFEWVAKRLNKERFNLSFILLNPADSQLEAYLKFHQIRFLRIKYSGKRHIISAFLQTYRYLRRSKVDIVHTHLFDANLVGLLAAYLAGVKKRIHTRHNSTIHHEYFPKAVKYDKLANFLSTDIIAISKVVEEVLHKMEGVNLSKITLIHHGFDFDEIPSETDLRVKKVENKYHFSEMDIIVGVVSRYIHWKGIQYIIPAFKEFRKAYPNAKLVLANASGPYRKEISKALQTLDLSSYVEIPFEEDIFSLFRNFSFLIHVPLNSKAEAFGQVYIEAMACEVPMIVTKSGIANEIVEHKKNALVVPFKDSKSIIEALGKLMNNPDLSRKIRSNGKKMALDNFDVKKMIAQLEYLYEK